MTLYGWNMLQNKYYWHYIRVDRSLFFYLQGMGI